MPAHPTNLVDSNNQIWCVYGNTRFLVGSTNEKCGFHDKRNKELLRIIRMIKAFALRLAIRDSLFLFRISQ